ncbi:hypothetical protein WR25_02156 isoform C [Diploscapter pachys]|uniref:Major facilitator superfamily (MFS) profile domain-containing protein n=1 Tax=Diploscapter pachys TaxID=2018661 RepID=A0A2A2KMF5_9BILA|nr:hypothetical protein WR25_02156 isoform C [Diploscapter pachys]
MKFDDFLIQYFGKLGRCALLNEPADAEFYTTSSISMMTNCKDANGNLVQFITNDTKGIKCDYYEQCTPDASTICDRRVYDHSHVEYSATERWNLVCNDGKWLRAHIGALYFVGQMIGSTLFGVLSDKIGRKKTFCMSTMLLIVCGIGEAFAPWLWLYGILKMGTGMAHLGCVLIGCVLTMESVSPEHRRIPSIMIGIGLGLGGKRYEEADRVFQRAAKCNRKTIPEKWWEDIIEDDSTTNFSESYSKSDNQNPQSNPIIRHVSVISQLFRTPELRKRTLVGIFIWIVVSMIFYGVSTKPDILGGDIYLTYIFVSVIEILAVFIVYYLVNRIGRRFLLSGGFFLSGLGLLISWSIDHFEFGKSIIIQMILTTFSMCAITIAFSVVYIHFPELYPTTIRNTAMGFFGTLARLGAISASYIVSWMVRIKNALFCRIRNYLLYFLRNKSLYNFFRNRILSSIKMNTKVETSFFF